MSVRHTLLGLLAQQPRYGYELRAAFTALAGGRENWDVSPAQIYTTLGRMRASGLIREDSPEATPSDRQFYTITDTGLQELKSWLSADERSEPQQDGFYLKLMLSRDLDFVETSRLIQVQRAGLYRDLHRVTRAREDLDSRSDLARILLMDKAIMHLEADLRWLDMIETRLDEMLSQPAPALELRPRGRPQKHPSTTNHLMPKEKKWRSLKLKT
ncbi:MAG TPA: helix-turn-helix transcriptional regulator [Anaerolineaceae bacterium]|nr:helix-turn-helix transcriptional regulator [Anaerolineaceae bacterium]